MQVDETGTLSEYGSWAGTSKGEDPSFEPGQAGGDLLMLFQRNYEIVFKVLRDERNMRNSRKQAAHNESELEYWQGRISNAQAGIDALIRMKDIGKIAFMRQRVEAYEQLALFEEGQADPKAMGF